VEILTFVSGSNFWRLAARCESSCSVEGAGGAALLTAAVEAVVEAEGAEEEEAEEAEVTVDEGCGSHSTAPTVCSTTNAVSRHWLLCRPPFLVSVSTCGFESIEARRHAKRQSHALCHSRCLQRTTTRARVSDVVSDELW
jgi:hypothetical protein